MQNLYMTHYYYPGTDPWQNIMNLSEAEAFRVAEELAGAHPGTQSFGRFADFSNYYPLRKKADQFVRDRFMSLSGKPELEHPYCFCLGESEYLRSWFSNGEKLVLGLAGIPDDVVKRAKVILKGLENDEGETVIAKSRAKTSEENEQTTFMDYTSNEIVEKLKNLDVDTVTPIEAMQILYQLHQESLER